MLNNVYDMWILPFGPMKVLRADQEGGLISHEASISLARHGIRLDLRPIGTKAHIVEAHHQILRDTYHKIRGQLEHEGVPYTPQYVLQQVATAKNSLINVGGCTPQMAVTGVATPLLQDLSAGLALAEDPASSDSRNSFRVREIAIPAFIQQHASERLRALQSKTKTTLWDAAYHPDRPWSAGESLSTKTSQAGEDQPQVCTWFRTAIRSTSSTKIPSSCAPISMCDHQTPVGLCIYIRSLCLQIAKTFQTTICLLH